MRRVLALFVVGLFAVPASATIYSDTVGDTFTTAGGGILDIVQLEVTNDLTDINFTFTLDGDVQTTDWGKYLIIFDSVAGGDPAGNGWGRPISMPSGADYWIGSWVDSGNGAEVYSWDGAVWNLDHATYNPPSDIDFPVTTPVTVSLTTTLASLGLSVGDSFDFDAFTSGGGGTDGAVDSLGNPNQQIADWGDASEAVPVSYTVVPEPATLALMALASLGIVRRRR